MTEITLTFKLTESQLEAITMRYGPWNDDVPEFLHEKKAVVMLKRALRLEAQQTIQAVVDHGVNLIEGGGWTLF